MRSYSKKPMSYHARFCAVCALALLFALAFSSCALKTVPVSDTAAGISGIVLNEAVSSNSLCHIDGKYGAQDWIELINLSASSIDISGWKISDDQLFKNAYVFPEGTVLEPGGILAFLCIPDVPSDSGTPTAPFGISKAGEKLFFSDGENTITFDIPLLQTDISYAMRSDGSYGYSSAPTFGLPNSNIHDSIDDALADISHSDELRFSEIVNGPEGWVELKNVTDAEIDLSGYYLSDNEEDPSKWAFPDFRLGAGEYVVVELNQLDPSAPLSASFKVSRTENAVYLFNNLHELTDSLQFDTPMPAGISAVATDSGVAYTSMITKGEENSDHTFAELKWTPVDLSSPDAAIYINEALADNKYGVTDVYGERSDWVEIFNRSENPVDLSGYYLSDREDDPLMWQLPKVALLPGEYVLIFLSGNETAGTEIHAPFKLSAGESLFLSRLDGMKQDRIDIPEGINPNVSVGRDKNYEILYYAAPTPGAANDTYGSDIFASVGGFDAHSLYISEVCAVSRARSGEKDWIELYNGSGSPMRLTGWSITDDPERPDKFKLDSFSISAGGYAVITCDSGASKGSGRAPFSISNTGDTIYLFDPEGAVRDVFETGATTVGMTSGREHLSQLGERRFFASATRGYENASPILGCVSEPDFSVASLFHSSSFKLALSCVTSGAEIRYTTDGSNPTKSSRLYSGPITISSNTVVKARAYLEGHAASPVTAHTYIFRDPHSLPVVSISLSSSDFSSMYTAVMSENGGVKHGPEVACYMEYYIGGKRAISSGAGVRVSGASTSVYPQKSLGLYFRAGYGRSSLDFPLFDGCKVSSFRSLVLRNGGQDAYNARIRDSYLSRICRGMNIDVAAFRPVVVYINGEYRGVYDLKENLNEDYLVSHYGIKRSTVDIIKRNGYCLAGDNSTWYHMLNMCKTMDFSSQANFNKLAELVDTDSIIDYLIARTYFYDGDMFNQKYWHTRDNKLKWRAVFYDSDYAMSGNSPAGNILPLYFRREGVSSAHGFITQMDIFCALNQNKAWRDKFITRYIYYVKYVFGKDKALSILDKLAAEYRPEMRSHIARWHMPVSMDKWETEISSFRRCLSLRPKYALQYLKSYYGLSDSSFAQYEAAADRMASGG